MSARASGAKDPVFGLQAVLLASGYGQQLDLPGSWQVTAPADEAGRLLTCCLVPNLPCMPAAGRHAADVPGAGGAQPVRDAPAGCAGARARAPAALCCGDRRAALCGRRRAARRGAQDLNGGAGSAPVQSCRNCPWPARPVPHATVPNRRHVELGVESIAPQPGHSSRCAAEAV